MIDIIERTNVRNPPRRARRSARGRQLLRRDLSAVLRVVARGRRSRRASQPCSNRRVRAYRWVSISTFRSAGSAVTSATSVFTPTRTPRRSGGISRCSAREWELYAQLPAIAGRPLNFVYFGGGTPSFLSTQQLDGLVNRLTAVTPWNQAEEITFECEPGTLTEHKLRAIRSMGVTRLSLGVENFDDRHSRTEWPRAPIPGDRSGLRLRAVARLSADQHRSDCRDARRDRGELAALHRADDRARSGQRHHLSDGAALQHDDQQGPAQGPGTVRGSARGLGDQAPLGTGGVRGARGGRLSRGQRLHRGQEPGADALHLPRSPLAGSGHGGSGRRVVRAHQRRAHAELRHLGDDTARRSIAASCRWPARIGPHPRSACGASWCCS